MKYLISILFSLLILLQSFSKVWITFSFKINQDYIARVLCVNRDKPELSCNGKCVLMQQVKAQEEQEKKDFPLKIKEQKDIVYCFERPSWQTLSIGLLHVAQLLPTYFQSPHLSYFVRDIFHPPNLASA